MPRHFSGPARPAGSRTGRNRAKSTRIKRKVSYLGTHVNNFPTETFGRQYKRGTTSKACEDSNPCDPSQVIRVRRESGYAIRAEESPCLKGSPHPSRFSNLRCLLHAGMIGLQQRHSSVRRASSISACTRSGRLPEAQSGLQRQDSSGSRDRRTPPSTAADASRSCDGACRTSPARTTAGTTAAVSGCRTPASHLIGGGVRTGRIIAS